MTKRQAENVGRALCGEHDAYRIVERHGDQWAVVIPLADETFITIHTGQVTTHFDGDWRKYPDTGINYSTMESRCWRTERPQSIDEERYS
jgi:hypothetical protein